ncbi:hypothetical protein OHD62_26990 [Mesorhizobium sp. YC-39]|uniref:hypothetical protein n=1 Tax=unclassified Mesorhizobium TaxID=325217 RepID=UPI0021E8E59D|nr:MULTISPECIES: hypothetical protein [unclassified Mesorhizobium]MCV3208616.1 hypothetical protein [Mesorhizobium sp. YC-2]MCV3232035.1 hypothetical protein [Mesorhizobium sp. YC-39]
MASKRARPFTSPIKAACSGLMALLLLSLLCLVQSEAAASATAASGGVGMTTARQDDAVAPLRGKAQPLEIRSGRLLTIKFVSGNPGALPPESAFFLLNQVSPARAPAVYAFVPAPQASANQPRAPPSI